MAWEDADINRGCLNATQADTSVEGIAELEMVNISVPTVMVELSPS